MGAYEKLSQGLIKRLKSLKQKKYREEYGEYLIEGQKTVMEALKCGARVTRILADGEDDKIREAANECGVTVYAANAETLRRLSDTKNPPKVIAYVKIGGEAKSRDGSLFVALDGMADPFNVGSVIRTADALGADGVWVSEHSCDIYNPKVQRAAMGSMFHIPVAQCDLLSKLTEFKAHGGSLIGTSPYGNAAPPPIAPKTALIIGSEAAGISREISAVTDYMFKIKMEGGAESLNAAVAAAIAIYIIKNNA